MPKAVRCTQGRLAGIAEVAAPGYGYTAEDVCYCPMPLFHGNALMALWGPAVMVGAAIAVRPRFSASAFLDDVRRFGATKFSYVGKAIAYILATPERPDDADNTLQSAFGTEASVRDRDRFRKRFGCYLIEGYGQSEGGAAINPVLGHAQGRAGQAGRRRRPGRHQPRDGRGVPAGRVRRRGPAPQRRRGHRRDRQPQRPRQVRGLLPARGRRSRNGCATGGTGPATSATSTPTGSSTSPAAPGTGSASTRRTSPPARSRRCSRGTPTVAVAAVYPVPDTASGAGDQVMVALETVPGRPFDPDAFAQWLAAQPDLGPEVGAALRAGLAPRSPRRPPAR